MKPKRVGFWFPVKMAWPVILVICCALFILLSFSGAFTYERGSAVTGELNASGRPDITVTPAKSVTGQATVSRATAAGNEAVEHVDEAIWENGELMPPLPRDPRKRAEAIAKARANATAALMGGEGVRYSGAASTERVEPTFGSLETVRHDVTPSLQPAVMEGERTHNLPLPDDFTLSREELRRIAGLSTSTRDETPAEPMAHALIQDFGGIDQTAYLPPSCDIAAGVDHIVVVVNSSFAIYDKCGNQLRETTFASFLGETTGYVFDPRVMYDIWDGHWVMTVAVRRDATSEAYVVVIVSATNNPTGSWWWYYFDITRDGGSSTNNWGDYQQLGADPDAVYITTNQFSFSPMTFQYAKIRILDKSEIYAAGPAGYHDFYNMNNPGDASTASAICPPKMHGYPGVTWLVNSKPGGGSFLTLWAITDPVGTPTLTGYNISLAAAYDNPPPALQPDGSYVTCGDARLEEASYLGGYVWTAAGHRKDTGEGIDRSEAHVYQIATSTKTIYFSGGLWAPGYYYAFPALDFDYSHRGVMVCSRGGPTEFLGARYADVLLGGGISSSSLLVSGQTNYAGGGSGTVSSPYRWGSYFGCDLDAFDQLSLWMYAQYASSSPTPSWDTHIGATAFDGAGTLIVSPISGLTTAGLEGGPFTPTQIIYSVENTGGAAFTWNLTGVDFWNTASMVGGQIRPGSNDLVTIALNSNANSLTSGVYNDYYVFTNCYDGSWAQRLTSLTVGVDGTCPGAVLDLIPDPTPVYSAPDDSQQRGVYVTAITDFNVCALGMRMDLEIPQTLTAQIYSADGTTRGALLATGTLDAVQPGMLIHYIPIDCMLNACQEYELTVTFGQTNSWDYWSEYEIHEPFDIGGAIRVRDGSNGGSAANLALPYFSVIGGIPECFDPADLAHGSEPTTAPDNDQERGMYVTALSTRRVCSLGWRADLVVPQTLTARIYEASGTTRGELIATGTAEATEPGNVFHNIPISAVLLDGHDYDFSVEFGTTNSWECWDDRVVAPYTVGDLVDVRDGEFYGGASNFILPHFNLGTGPLGGAPLDLGKHWADIDVYPPPMVSSQDGFDYGIYVTALTDEEIYSLGWRADIVPGQTLTIRVYEASGTSRGSLIAQGSVVVTSEGMMWHDVPITVSLEAGNDYDFEVDIPDINLWRAWLDHSGLPYQPYGVVEVLNGEQGGDPANSYLIHMRMFACDPVMTGVVDLPDEKVPFYLAPVSPNPVSGIAQVRYSLDEGGEISMKMYDVSGRLVATLIDGESQPAGTGLFEFDASRYATGVYFLRIELNSRMLSRKMLIMR